MAIRRILNDCATPPELKRYNLASERIPIVKAFLAGELNAQNAATTMGMTPSAFYKIVRRVTASGGDLSYVMSRKPGRKGGSVSLDPEVEALIEETFKHYHGRAATFANVWKHASALADARMLKRPSYHVVKNRLQAKGTRMLTEWKLGKADADDLMQARPGYKKTSKPLEWVQIDHTRVDLILVDENDRSIVLERPWVSFAICIHTRVIIGFYLSLLPPNAVSVAMLIENCVLPKCNLLSSVGLNESLWPMYGIPETIHADNAAEFRSETLKANLSRFGIKMEHRDIGKKHQGGHIERWIGTMMSSEMHFLRGTTYSNPIQRGNENSEKRASFTLSALRQFMILSIHSYHERKHSEIRMTPAEKWNNYFAQHVGPIKLNDTMHEDFRYSLYPEKVKLIRAGGIEMHNRFYYSRELQQQVRQKLMIKYDPHDLSCVLADLKGDGNYIKIPCSRNDHFRSVDYALYRAQRQIKGERDGTVSRAGAASIILGQQIARDEKNKTSKRKRELTRTAGIADKKRFADGIRHNTSTVPTDEVSKRENNAYHKSRISASRSKKTDSQTPKTSVSNANQNLNSGFLKNQKEGSKNGNGRPLIGFDNLAKAELAINFNDPPVIS